jgi:hypothetical protein
LRPGTPYSPSLQFTNDGDCSLSSPEYKGTPVAKTSFMSNKRAGKSEERSLIKKRRLAIRSGKKLPTASIIPSTNKIATIIEDATGIQSSYPTIGRDEPPVHKTYTRPHIFKDIFLEVVVEQGHDSMWMYFMKFLSPSDLLIILTSNKGPFFKQGDISAH